MPPPLLRDPGVHPPSPTQMLHAAAVAMAAPRPQLPCLPMVTGEWRPPPQGTLHHSPLVAVRWGSADRLGGQGEQGEGGTGLPPQKGPRSLGPSFDSPPPGDQASRTPPPNSSPTPGDQASRTPCNLLPHPWGTQVSRPPQHVPRLRLFTLELPACREGGGSMGGVGGGAGRGAWAQPRVREVRPGPSPRVRGQG